MYGVKNVFLFSDSKTKIFSTDLNDESPFSRSIYQYDFTKFDIPPAEIRITSPGRRHKPQPTSVNFNNKNSRTLCTPFCCVETRSVKNEEGNWWPDKIPKIKKKLPKYSLDSTFRSDYQPIDIIKYVKSSKDDTDKSMKAEKQPQIRRERISFEHNFNCRLPNGHPERGKRHGSFISKQ